MRLVSDLLFLRPCPFGEQESLFDLVVDRKKEYSYYEINNRGMAVVRRVAAYVKECLRRMKAGQMPPSEVDGNLPIKWFSACCECQYRVE